MVLLIILSKRELKANHDIQKSLCSPTGSGHRHSTDQTSDLVNLLEDYLSLHCLLKCFSWDQDQP